MHKEYFDKVAGTLAAETGLDKDTSEELVSLFYSKAADNIKLTRRAYTKKDYEKVKEQVHKIKGSSGNIRAADISQIALKIEEQLKADPQADIQNMIDQMEILINKLGG